MNLTKQDFTNAINALKNTEIVINKSIDKNKFDWRCQKGYSGKFSSIGPDSIYMGLIPAVALYESNPNDEAGGFIKAQVCQAILKLMPQVPDKQYTLLYQYLRDNDDKKTQFNIDKAIVLLKLTLRLFKEN